MRVKAAVPLEVSRQWKYCCCPDTGGTLPTQSNLWLLTLQTFQLTQTELVMGDDVFVAAHVVLYQREEIRTRTNSNIKQRPLPATVILSCAAIVI